MSSDDISLHRNDTSRVPCPPLCFGSRLLVWTDSCQGIAMYSKALPLAILTLALRCNLTAQRFESSNYTKYTEQVGTLLQ